MSVKSLRNQLLAAIAMVLVATIALGSSTYAWFASNGSVKAQGMNVQAVAEAGIEIAPMTATLNAGVLEYSAADDAYETVVSAANSNTAELYPTSTLDAKNWFHARAELMAQSGAKEGTYEKLTTISTTVDGLGTVANSESGLDGDYYLYNQFHIRTTNATAQAENLKITGITVTDNGEEAADLNKAVRVAVVYNNSIYAVFAPVYDAAGESATNENVVTGEGIDNSGAFTANGYKDSSAPVTYVQCNGFDGTPEDLTIDHTNGVEVGIYVFFEGEDTNLFSNNIDGVEVGDLSVTVSFAAEIVGTN